MNILIIYCHPSKNSYTYQILQQLLVQFGKMHWNVEVSDLYASDFHADMTEQEYERESLGNYDYPISADVEHEQKKLDKADCVIFLYPVWWSDVPAKLKGWFDRVLTIGFAYKHKEGILALKPVKCGIVLCTAGYTNEYLEEIGIAQSMRKVMLMDRLGNRFIQKEMVVLGGTINLDIVRHDHEVLILRLIQKIGSYCA